MAAWLADGENVRDIARATGLTEGAIYWHLKQIYRKLPISRQVDLTTMSPTLPILAVADSTMEAVLRAFFGREQALMFSGSLRQHLQDNGQWPAGAPKPLEPKETIQALVKAKKALKTKVVYSRIARSISIQGCTDQSFDLFANTIRLWFPQGAP